MSEGEHQAPGWDAITAAMARVHGGVEPLHWATAVPTVLGGTDPLQGISAYPVDEPGVPPHWHLVTYGLTDLYEKEGEDKEVSGYGFELTMRLRRRGEAHPPGWALSFLNNLARYVFRTGNTFSPGDGMNLNGPIALDTETAIRAAAFVEDPSLPAVDTVNGRVTFIQILGLTLDEREAAAAWTTEGLVGLLAKQDPRLLVDLERRSILEDPGLRALAEEGSRREGSSQGVVFVAHLEWVAGREAVVTMGATAAGALAEALPRRLPFGRTLACIGKVQALRVEPGAPPAWRAEEDVLVLTLPPAACAAFLEALPARRGTYRWPDLPGLTVTVVPSEIKDGKGGVVEVVG